MGQVYTATDLRLLREVAIKTLRPEASPERFVTECRITAKLSHPNIPPVYELGELADGTPFMAMKLVRGRTLADVLDASPHPRHDLPRFVGVFEQICQAVGFAHSRGVIHRDLKPLNVMVGEFGEVQVMDWGLAKEVAARGAAPRTRPAPTRPPSDSSDATADGSVLGTPSYIPPEQSRGEVADPRADVFALGTILCEALTGGLVWGTGPRPVVLARAAHGLVADAHAQLDGCGADAELIALAKRCLAADPAARPPDARAVAAEVAGYRAGVGERLRLAEVERGKAEVAAGEQRKRRRVVQRAAGVEVGVLIAGIIGTVVGLAAALEARRAEQERADREAVQVGLKEEQRALADDARRLADLRRREAEEAVADLWNGLNAMTAGVVGESLATQPAVSDEQKAFLSGVLPLYQKLAARAGHDEGTRERVARAALRVGVIEYRLGRKEEGAAAFRLGRDEFARLAADFPADPTYLAAQANCHCNLGLMLEGLGQLQAAEAEYRRGLALQERLAADSPTLPYARSDLARTHLSLGRLLTLRGDPKGGEEHVRIGQRSFAGLAAEFPNDPDHRLDVARTHNSLGNLLTDRGQTKDAEAEFRAGLVLLGRLSADSPRVAAYRAELARTHNNLGRLYGKLGKPVEEEAEYRTSLALKEELVTDFPAVPDYRADLARSHPNLGRVLKGRGETAAAEKEYRKALDLEKKLAADSPGVPIYRTGLARSHQAVGELLLGVDRTADAEVEFRLGLDVQEKLVADFPDTADHRAELARSYTSMGNLLSTRREWATAEEFLRNGLKERERLAADFPHVADYRREVARSHFHVGNLLADRGQSAAAEAEYRTALALQEKLAAEFPAVAAYRSDQARSLNNLGNMLSRQKKAEEAEKHYRQALQVREKLVADSPGVSSYRVDLGGNYNNLGLWLQEGGRPADSLPWYERAIQTLEPVHQKEPRAVTPREFLRNALQGRATSYDRLGKHAEAAKDWDRVIELTPDGEKAGLRVTRARSMLAAGRAAVAVAEAEAVLKLPDLTPLHLYSLACVYSLAAAAGGPQQSEYADAAVGLLRQAVKAGYQNTTRLTEDQDLAPLRGRDDFKKLVAELEAKFPPPKREVLPPPRADVGR
jgi:tetratricopeptide (TPR) repeat protein